MSAGDSSGAGVPVKRRSALAFPERLVDLNRSAGRLGPLLAWAVVYADIGTSVYYVPGLLFTELGGRTPSPAAAFVLVTGLAVILLALKYVDVSARYPDGGGVVSVATDAFNPIVGCVGGILICISYFLTAAISAVSGLQYLAGLFPALDHWLVPGACAAIILLGMLNYIGVRESAILTAVLALASFATNVVVLTTVSVQLDAAQWRLVMDQFKSATALPPWPLLVGFSGSWLAYSGLESISQIAPALHPPRERTALRAMILVMAAILLTSPLATALETALLKASQVNPDRFMFELGAAFGPRALQLAIVGHVGGAAARRRQHRPDRLLPRVPGAGPPRVPAPLAVRAQPPVQHAPPRHRDLGAGAGGGRRRVAGAARPPRPHLHVRPAGRVHADQRRPRQGQVAGERARPRLLLRRC